MKKIFSLLPMLCVWFSSMACSCGPPQYDFYKNINKNHHICFAVLQHFDYGFEYMGLKGQTAYFTLIDTIGVFDSDIGNTIVVTGQDGLNCGEIMGHFRIGDTMVLALLKGFYYTFKKDSFYLDGCGTHYQYFSSGNPNGTSIEEIKQKIRSVITNVNSPSEEDDFTIYPNPTIHGFYVRSKNDFIIRIEIYDRAGRLVEQIMSPNPFTQFFDIVHYNPGLYIIYVFSRNGDRTYNLIKI